MGWWGWSARGAAASARACPALARYGWHFPEMTKVVADNVAYARAIRLMGVRTVAAGTDFSEALDEETEAALKAAALVSMGTEINDQDCEHIGALADQARVLGREGV